MKRRIFFDIDGTLNKITEALIDEESGKVNIEKMYKEKDFFTNLKVENNMLDFLKMLQEDKDNEIFILSSCELGDPPGFEKQKLKWLEDNDIKFDESHIIFSSLTSKKVDNVPDGIKDNDILIDDYNVNLNEWIEAAKEKRVQALAIKACTNYNDTGTGKSGGDVNSLWSGDRVYSNLSAKDNKSIFYSILEGNNIANTKEFKKEFETNKLHPNEFYFSEDYILDDYSMAEVYTVAGNRTIFKLYEYPNSQETFLFCDDCDIENSTIKNFSNSQAFSKYEDAFKYMVLDVINESKPADATKVLSKFDDDEIKKIIKIASNEKEKFKKLKSDRVEIFDEFLKTYKSYQHNKNNPLLLKDNGISELVCRSDKGIYNVVAIDNDGNEKKLFSTPEIIASFYVKNINGFLRNKNLVKDHKENVAIESKETTNENKKSPLLDSVKDNFNIKNR